MFTLIRFCCKEWALGLLMFFLHGWKDFFNPPFLDAGWQCQCQESGIWSIVLDSFATSSPHRAHQQLFIDIVIQLEVLVCLKGQDMIGCSISFFLCEKYCSKNYHSLHPNLLWPYFNWCFWLLIALLPPGICSLLQFL